MWLTGINTWGQIGPGNNSNKVGKICGLSYMLAYQKHSVSFFDSLDYKVKQKWTDES